MQRSVAKILTTHVGSLPFLSLDRGVAVGDQSQLAGDVAAIVARQREIGIDIINEGEYAKGGDWLRYMQNRFGGFTEISVADEKPLIERGKDREQFADFYKYASERGTLFYTPGAQIAKKRPVQACTGSVSYVAQAELKKEIDVTRAIAGADNVFLTSTASGSLEVYRCNRHYKRDEEYVFALAEAMRVEYEAIAVAGLILQIDDAWLPALWDRIGTVKLPGGKILIPGVVTHSTDVVEHPQLVSQRLQRYARRVGRENVIAGADCGFGGRSHPQIAWAKLRALVEGAALASKALGFAAA